MEEIASFVDIGLKDNKDISSEGNDEIGGEGRLHRGMASIFFRRLEDVLKQGGTDKGDVGTLLELGVVLAEKAKS